MANAWRVIIIIVLIAAIMGAVLIGVGMANGAKFDRMYATVADRYGLVRDYNAYVDFAYDFVNKIPEIVPEPLRPVDGSEAIIE